MRILILHSTKVEYILQKASNYHMYILQNIVFINFPFIKQNVIYYSYIFKIIFIYFLKEASIE